MTKAPGPRVLAVDNDTMILFVLRLQLEEQGYEVATLTSGKEALDYLHQTTQPHVVLLDVVMPDMDGVQILEKLAHDPVLVKRHRFALMTGGYPTLRAKVDKLLARLEAPVLLKPYDLELLFETVAMLAAKLTADAAIMGDQGGQNGIAPA